MNLFHPALVGLKGPVKYVGYLYPPPGKEGEPLYPRKQGGREKSEGGFIRFDPLSCSLEEIFRHIARAKMVFMCRLAKGTETRVDLGEGRVLVARPVFRELGKDAGGSVLVSLEGGQVEVRLTVTAPADVEVSRTDVTLVPGVSAELAVSLKADADFLLSDPARGRKNHPAAYRILQVEGEAEGIGRFSFPVVFPLGAKTLPEMEGTFRGWGEKTQSGGAFGVAGDAWPPPETPAVPFSGIDLR